MNQNQLAELFDTSKQGIGQHIANMLNDRELDANSVVKDYLTTAADVKNLERRKSNLHFLHFPNFISNKIAPIFVFRLKI